MGFLSAPISAAANITAATLNYKGTQYAADKQLEATRATNEMNYKIQQEANAQNYQMFKEQQQYDLDMWNAQNVYNSAEQQRARLEAAGLNPYLMINGGSAGTAGAANSASPIAAQAAKMETPQIGSIYQQGFSNVASIISQLGNDINSALVADAQRNNIIEDTKSKALDNEYKPEEKRTGIENTLADTEYKKADTEFKKADTDNKTADTNNKRIQSNLFAAQSSWQTLQNDFFEKNSENLLLRSTLENENLKQSKAESEARTALINLDIQAKEILNKYVEPNAIRDLALKAAQIANLNADAGYKTEMAKVAVAQATGLKLNNSIVESTADSLIKATNAENKDTHLYYTEDYAYGHAKMRKPWQERRVSDHYDANQKSLDYNNPFKFLGGIKITRK